MQPHGNAEVEVLIPDHMELSVEAMNYVRNSQDLVHWYNPFYLQPEKEKCSH